MRKRGTRAAIAATLLGGAVNVSALGLGPARLTAVLGQSLDVAVPLQMEGSEQLVLDCIEAKVFFGEERLAPHQIRLQLESSPSGRGERLLRISTLPVVHEPLVSIVVTAGCGSAVAREFVAFADPPAAGHGAPLAFPPLAASAPLPAATSLASAPRERASAKGTPSEPQAQGSSRSKKPARPEEAAGAEKALTLAAPRGDESRSRTEAAPRLKLEPLVPELAAAGQPAETDPTAVTGGAPGAGGASTTATADAARLQMLEATLAEVRSELSQTRRMLEVLDLQAREAKVSEAPTPTNTLLYVLAGLTAALGAAVGWLLLERRRDRAAAAAWDEGLIEPEVQQIEPLAVGSALQPSEPAKSLALHSSAPLGSHDEDAAEPSAPFALSLPPDLPLEASATASRSVLEALLDLDQQLVFFVALGQDEAAIALLQSHLEQSAAASPLPWLELLALYQRSKDRNAFESVAPRYAARFATAIPAWETDVSGGKALEDDPLAIEQLEWRWRNAEEACATLGALLLPSRGQGRVPDLPACQDLLLLYAVLRERLDLEAAPLAWEAPSYPLSPLEVKNPPDAEDSEFIELPLTLEPPLQIRPSEISPVGIER